MKTLTPQDAAAWMAQLSDPNAWQSWLKQPQMGQLNGNGLLPGSLSSDLAVLIEPEALTRLQSDYVREFSTLWQSLVTSSTPDIKDKRFSGEAWKSNALYAFNAAAYLLNARFMMAMAEAVKASPKVKQKIRFAIQQTIDAMSPSNFLVTNPEAQKKLVETKGESLAKGIALMLADMQKGRISQTDESAFKVGENVATTEGAVVFENELFQLIQYKPLTKTVFERPLLLVPPCINKFYIMDLQPSNSLVRYAVEQGHTVFLVSWINPDASLKQASWDDYIETGAIKAIEVVREISGQDQVNTLGFCVGGTIVATALSIMLARGDKPASSLTLLTTLLDFFRHRGAGSLYRRSTGGASRSRDRRRRHDAGQGLYRRLLQLASKRSGLELRGAELSERRGAAGLRFAVLECGRDQSPWPDVLLLPAQHVSGKQSARAWQAAGGRAER